MPNTEILNKLNRIAENSDYAKKIVAELSTSDKQTIKDRLDERLGEAEGWLAKDAETCKGNPSEVAEHVEILKKMISAIE